MKPEELKFEGGMHPEHDRINPEQYDANLAWFAEQWHRLKVGGMLGTAMCVYVKTETGFRRQDYEKKA